MEDFRVFYNENEDILYLAKEGHEAETEELSPGVNAELDVNGTLIGVEIFNASSCNYSAYFHSQPLWAGEIRQFTTEYHL